MSLMNSVHWIAGLITLAEALNKLERCDPCKPGMARRRRAVEWLKAAAWMLLALGAGGAVVSPLLLTLGVRPGDSLLMRLDRPTLAETCVMFGFAVLIIRTRVKEG